MALVGDEFRVNTFTNDNQSFPEIAMAPDGSAAVTWESIGQDNSNHAVAAQRYHSDGSPAGAEFIVNTETADTQSQPSAAMADDGSFIIFWRSKFQDGSEFGLYAQRYSSAGATVGGEFRVNVATDSNQEDAHVAFDSNGNMLVAYQSPDSASSGVFARLYDSAGQPAGEFQVNETTQEWQQDPEVITTPGGFVIVWASRAVDADNRAIMLKRYSSTGTPIGNEQRVNSTEIGDQKNPGIATRSDGSFDEIWGRRLLVSGAFDGDEFRVNNNTTNRQVFPAIGGSDHGELTAVWHSWTGDGSGTTVAGQRLSITGVFRDGFETGDTSAWGGVAP